MRTPRFCASSIAGRRICPLLVPEQTVFAGMRVETGKGETRLRNAETSQLAGGQVDDSVDDLAREGAGHRGQRNMNRREHHLERLRPEHHRDPWLPVRCASNSVCPFQGSPARAKASLLTGAVATAGHNSRLRILDSAERVS